MNERSAGKWAWLGVCSSDRSLRCEAMKKLVTTLLISSVLFSACQGKVSRKDVRVRAGITTANTINPNDKHSTSIAIESSSVTVEPGTFSEVVTMSVGEYGDIKAVEEKADGKQLANNPIEIKTIARDGQLVKAANVLKDILITFKIESNVDQDHLEGIIITQPDGAIIKVAHEDLTIEENSDGTLNVSIKTNQVNAVFVLVISDDVIAKNKPNPPAILGADITNLKRPAWSWVSGGGGGNGNYRYKLDDEDLTQNAIATTEPNFTPAEDLSEGTHTLYVQEMSDSNYWSDSGSKAVKIDITPPVPGGGGTITSSNIGCAGASLSWTAATDNLVTQYAVYESSANNINSVAEAETSGTLKMDYVSDILTYTASNLSLSSTYYFNVISKDAAGNKASYSTSSITTSADCAVAMNLTSSSATAQSPSRKSFFDTENSKHWAFYHTGTAIKYAYSTQGKDDWIEPETQSLTSYNTASFSVTYKSPYVFVAIEDGYDVLLFRGTLSASSISFDPAIAALAGTSAADRYKMPSIAVSGNHKVTIAAFHNSSTFPSMYSAGVRMSTNDYGAELSLWGTFQTVGPSTGSLSGLSLMSKGVADGDLLLLTSSGGNKVLSFSFDGASWTENVGSEKDWFMINATGQLNGDVSAIAVSGNNVYVGGSFTDAGGNSDADYIATWNGISWGSLGHGLNGAVYAIAISGSDVYAGGQFTDAGDDANADYVAKWNGSSWSALDTGLNGGVAAIAISGSDVYVEGWFTDAGGDGNADRIAKWNGTSWSALGTGLNGNVYAIAISGSDVYAGGCFTDAGGNADADYIAKWNGTSWTPLGGGLNGCVTALATSGSNIYVGGLFTDAGGDSDADRIAKWNGTSWSALGAGLNSIVYAIAISGSNVYAGGRFTNAGGDVSADNIAKWNGTSWSALDTGLNNNVNAIVISGSSIYVGGGFTDAGGNAGAHRIIKWDGNSFGALDTTTLPSWGAFSIGLGKAVRAVGISGNDVYVGGEFIAAGGNPDADYIAKWNGTSWSTLGTGLNGNVYSITVSGSDVYVGGEFTDAGGNTDADHIAKWNGTSWSALGAGVNGTAYAIAISGGAVYVGGSFTDAGGDANADNIAKWNGTSWDALGSGLSGVVNAIAVSGSDVYVGGQFTDAGGDANADNIAKWNGTSWNALGTGLNGMVNAIAIFGGDVYVGGWFTDAGGDTNADRIAKWSGTVWGALGSGLSDAVYAIVISESAVYVGGWFTDAGGDTNADRIAKWDGMTWNALGTGLESAVNAIAISGSSFYAGGFNYISCFRNVSVFARSFSSVYNPANNRLGLLYSDINSAPRYKSWNAVGGWNTAISFGASNDAINGVSLSLKDGSSDLYGIWSSGTQTLYKIYSLGAWSEAAQVPGSATNNLYPMSEEFMTDSILSIIWTRQSSETTFDVISGTLP